MTDSSPALAPPARRVRAGRGGRQELTGPPAAGVLPDRPGPPVLRLLPAPVSEPPYDDEPGPPPSLRLVPRTPALVPGPTRPAAVAAPRAAALPAGSLPEQSVALGLPAARPFAIALVHRLIEVRGGVRPVLQLQRDTTPGLYADLERGLQRQRPTTGTRPSGRDVHSVHVQERPDGVAEVCAVVSRGTRVGALALRLEVAGGRWLCTQVQGL